MTITTQFGEFAVAVQHEMYQDGFTKPVPAQGSVTFLAQPNDGDTLTIDGVVYRFKTTPSAANDVKIGTTLAVTLLSLQAALQGTIDAGVFAATQPGLRVIADLGTAALFIEYFTPGITGNSSALAQSGGSSARYTLSASTLLNGLNGYAARFAQGRIAITIMPVNTDTLVVGSTTYTFSSTLNTGNNINITLAGQSTIQGLASTIAARLVSNTAVASPVAVGSEVSFTNSVAGVAGNSTVLTVTVITANAIRVSGAGTLVNGSDATPYDASQFTWWRLRSREIDYGDNQMQDIIPLEIGGTMTPTGAYKQGVNVVGGAQLMPRLATSIGVILLCALGQDVVTNPSAGVYTHTFKFQTNEINIPWLAARRMIPGRDNVFGVGIVGYDNKVNLLRTTVAATAPVEMMLQLMGRVPIMDNHPETWLGNAFEDFTSIPLACQGIFKLPNVAGLPNPLPVTQCIVEMSNVTTTPREEMVVGSYFPDDVVPRTRALTFRFVYKWRDPSFAQYLFGNQLKATAWSPQPFITSAAGGEFAADLQVISPNVIPGTTTKYGLEIQPGEVFWQPSPLRLRAGDIVTMEIIGTVLFSGAGNYANFVLTNGQSAAYTVPAEP